MAPDILSAKLNLLRSLSPAEASPQHPDDNDNRVDDDVEADPEIQSLKPLFPSRLSFLDLSSLKLEQDRVRTHLRADREQISRQRRFGDS